MQHIDGSCFFIRLASLCVLIGEFSPLAFKVIIEMYVPTDILLVFSWLYCTSFVSSFSVAFFLCNMMISCIGMLRVLYLLCIFCRFLLSAYNGDCINQCIFVSLF